MSATFVITAAEAYLRQALAELRGLDPRLGPSRPLSPGVLLVTTAPDTGRREFLARLMQREPVFVRHVHPVDITLPQGAEVDGACGALLAGSAPTCGPGAGVAGETVAVQVRHLAAGDMGMSRSDLRERLDGLVSASGGRPVTQGANWILSVTVDREAVHAGLSTPAENLSDWPGGEIRFRREEEQVSRAKFKLLEAMYRWKVPLPSGGSALDLGAAPGGWTSLLLERGLKVTAVDTGELAPGLAGDPHLTYIQKNVDEIAFPVDAFDLVTCDMSWNPLNTARLVARLGPSVRAGAHLILTVKLMLQNPTRTIRLVGEALEPQFRVLAVKQLFHNRDEVTMLLVRP